MVDFRIDVVVDPSGAVAGTRTVERELTRVENRADRLRTSLTRALAIFGGGAILSSAVRTLAEFDQALSTVAAVSGATAAELEVLRDKALELGATTRFTAVQAADSLTELTRAGFTANEALAAVGDTLVLAQAGALGLTQATDIAASTLRGFRLQADQAGRVADVLAAAANSTNTSVQELGEGMKFVAPIAAGLNVTLEESAAAMGVLSDAGLKASLAGTGLRRVLAELESPSANSEKILKRLGITAEEVRVSQVGLTEAIQRLAEAGIDTGQALELFGDRGGPAFEVLSKNIDRVEELTNKFENVAGTAKQVAAVMDDNLNGALLRVRSAFESLVLAVGQAGGTAGLRSFLEGLAAGIRFLAANADVVINFAKNLALFLGPRYLLGAIKALTVAIAANPLGLLLTVIAGVVAAIPDLQGKLTSLIGTIGELSTALTAGLDFSDFLTGIAAAVDSVIALFNGLLAAAGTVFDQLGEKPEVVGELMKDAFRRAVVASLNFFLAFAQTVGNIITGIGKDILDIVSSSINAASRVIRGDLENASTYADLATSAVTRATNRLTTFGGQFENNLKKIQDVKLFGDAPVLSKEAADLGAMVASEFNRAVAETTPDAQTALNNLLGKPEELAAAAAERARKLTENLPKPEPIQPPAEQEAKLSNRAQEILEQIDTIAALREEEAALNEVLAQRPDLMRSIEDAMLAAQIAALETSTALEDGFTRAFLKLQQEANDLAAVAEGVVNAFADRATDAIIEFTKTGEFNFKKFATAVLEDITRILVRLLVVQAISAAVGGGGGGLVSTGVEAAAGGGGGRAHGGTVQPDRSYVVGEQGPELFQPNTTGTIVPNAASVEQPAPQVNVQVVTVDDPAKVPQSIAAGDADEAIINALARNKDRVSQVIR